MTNKVNSKPPDWDALAKTIYRYDSKKENIAVFFRRLIRRLTFRFAGEDKIINLFRKAIQSPEQHQALQKTFFTLFKNAKLSRTQAAKVLSIRRDLGIALPARFEALAISDKNDSKYSKETARMFAHTEYVQKLEAEYLVVDVPGDGDCFFYSLAHQIYPEMIESGEGKKAMLRVREELSAYMNRPENRAFFVPLIDEGVDFDAYIASIGRSSSGKENREGWGGQPELIAASQFYKRPLKMFVSYGQENRPDNLQPNETYGSELPGEPLHMLFNGENHWEAMIPLEKMR